VVARWSRIPKQQQQASAQAVATCALLLLLRAACSCTRGPILGPWGSVLQQLGGLQIVGRAGAGSRSWSLEPGAAGAGGGGSGSGSDEAVSCQAAEALTPA
jgi:hypothetical protein